jgi:hypothetical protein
VIPELELKELLEHKVIQDYKEHKELKEILERVLKEQREHRVIAD